MERRAAESKYNIQALTYFKGQQLIKMSPNEAQKSNGLRHQATVTVMWQING